VGKLRFSCCGVLFVTAKRLCFVAVDECFGELSMIWRPHPENELVSRVAQR
jgi:hypothetical protein